MAIEGKRQRGFTLLEVVLVLTLVGLLAAAVGLGMAQALQGYLFAKENAPLTQKAQLAMSRMTRELMEISGLPVDGAAGRITFRNIRGTWTIAQVGGNVRIIEGVTPPTDKTGDTLVDNVQSLRFTYNGADSWPTANDIRTLEKIGIRLILQRRDPFGGTLEFYVEVNPRNNMTFNAPVI